MESSFILGVSQVSIENEYYMSDIPELLQLTFKKMQADQLAQLQILIASNNRTLEEKEYAKFIKTLIPVNSSITVEDTTKFNRDKLEQLRRRG